MEIFTSSADAFGASSSTWAFQAYFELVGR